MADLLAPGIWWLHGTRGSNVYVVEADDGRLALIDTGFASSAAGILAELKALDRPLAAILLTHMHRDHSGAAAALREATGASVAIGLADCYEADGRVYVRASVGRSHPARFLLSRVRETPAVAVDIPLDGESEVLPGIRAVPVPGHTPGSYCFVVERRTAAFVGDLVISHGGRLTRAMRMANRDDNEYLESLQRFADVAPRAGFPGHGEPLLEGFGASLKALAALPRNRTDPGGILRRPLRLLRFSRQMLRTRRRR